MRSGAASAKTAKTNLPAYIAIAVGFAYLAAILDAWIRTGACPADGQTRSLTLSTRGGALQILVNGSVPLDTTDG